MATTKRIKGDYVITSIGNTDNVVINTNTINANASMRVINLTVTGNVALPAGGDIAVGNISANNGLLAGSLQVNKGITVPNGAVSASGNIVGAVFIGDGSGLTGIAAGNALGNIISYGVSQVAIPGLSGNVFINVGGVSNVAVFSSGGANISGNISANAYYWSNGVPFSPGGSVTYDAFPVAPGNANVGDFWFNTTNGILYQYNDDGDSNQWVDQSGVATPPSTTSAVANTVVQRDFNGSTTANVVSGNSVLVTGNITSTGGFFIGNGSQLTGVVASSPTLANGTSQISIPSSSGEIRVQVTGLTTMAFTTNGIVNYLGNGIGDIGNASSYFNTIYAKSTSAQYADLAEIYEADEEYPPGTVLIFFGSKDVTTTNLDHDPKVAGVVSSNPAYLMNSGSPGIKLALTGRVPCLVQGPVNKGDLLVTSHKRGVAQVMDPEFYVPGCILGKSLTTYEGGDIQLVDIAVGRY